MKEVIIDVVGGVATLVQKPEGVVVLIRDFDVNFDDEKNHVKFVTQRWGSDEECDLHD